MTGRFVMFLSIAALVVGAILYFGLAGNQSGLLTLEGSQITGLRLQKMADGATMAIADFELKNPSDSDFEVRKVELALVLKEGINNATLLSKVQASDYFRYEKLDQPNKLFSAGDVVKAGSKKTGGMVLGRFEAAPESLADKTFRVKLTSVNGIAVQLIGKK